MGKKKYKKKIKHLEKLLNERDERYMALQDMMQMTAAHLNKTKGDLERINKQLMGSIQYAKRIQQSMLDSDEQTKQVFPKSYVFYRPKDVLSGDLYWFRETMGMDFIAAVDCTGHGVPAAMLTVLALSLLNQIVMSFGINDPAEVLVQLDVMLAQYTYNESKVRKVKDGLDMVMLRYDEATREVVAAGAHRPLYVVRDGELIEYKGARYSLGTNTERSALLINHTFTAMPNDMLYLLSDGFPDQFGGKDGKKYMVGKFKKLLLELAPLPLGEQEARLTREFEQWKGDNPQTDDVLVIALRC